MTDKYTNEVDNHNFERLITEVPGRYRTEKRSLRKVEAIWNGTLRAVHPVQYDKEAKDYFVMLKLPTAKKPAKFWLWRLIEMHELFFMR